MKRKALYPDARLAEFLIPLLTLFLPIKAAIPLWLLPNALISILPDEAERSMAKSPVEPSVAMLSPEGVKLGIMILRPDTEVVEVEVAIWVFPKR